MSILVTGAAGYVGSVITERLVEEGHHVIALDNLWQGHREALDADAVFVRGDLCEPATLDGIFSQYQVTAVMHLAGLTLVADSVADPQRYFQANLVCGINLLNSMVKHHVDKLVFSSSAAIYGNPQEVPIPESATPAPVNPYGESKLMLERVMRWYADAYGLNSVSLRYFNAAGATPLHGEHHRPETHLIPRVLAVAMGKEDHVAIFGSEYDTPDGTCIRDYVHVLDIANAHTRALARIDGAGARAYNLGNERGYSVLEVVRTAEKVTGAAIPVVFQPPRAGDPPVLVASAEQARRELGWCPRFSRLEDIIASAWQWQRRFPDGYSS